jgi:hypothetical protein
MIYEFKTYKAAPGKVDALIARFREKTLPIFSRLGIEVVCCWTSPDDPQAFHYLTRFPSEAARKAAGPAFAADQEWQAAKAASETNGPLLASQSSITLDPAQGFPAAMFGKNP